jgi:hypothetical protein
MPSNGPINFYKDNKNSPYFRAVFSHSPSITQTIKSLLICIYEYISFGYEMSEK